MIKKKHGSQKRVDAHLDAGRLVMSYEMEIGCLKVHGLIDLLEDGDKLYDKKQGTFSESIFICVGRLSLGHKTSI